MSDVKVIADRFEIEALRGEVTDAAMMRDYDRFESLFARDGAVRMSHINAEATSREEIRAGFERMQGLCGARRKFPGLQAEPRWQQNIVFHA